MYHVILESRKQNTVFITEVDVLSNVIAAKRERVGQKRSRLMTGLVASILENPGNPGILKLSWKTLEFGWK